MMSFPPQLPLDFRAGIDPAEEQRVQVSENIARSLLNQIQALYDQMFSIESAKIAASKPINTSNITTNVVPTQTPEQFLSSLIRQLQDTRSLASLSGKISTQAKTELQEDLARIIDEMEATLLAKDFRWSLASGDYPETIFNRLRILCIDIGECLKRISNLGPGGCCGPNKNLTPEIARLEGLRFNLRCTRDLYIGYLKIKPSEQQVKKVVEYVPQVVPLKVDQVTASRLFDQLSKEIYRSIPMREVEVKVPIKQIVSSQAVDPSIRDFNIEVEDFVKGMNYFYGNGYVQNYPKSVQLLEKSRKARNPKAATFLGKMYMEGKGVVQSDQKATECFADAAREEDPQAQYLLGKLLEEGKVAKDTPGIDYNFTQYYQIAAVHPEEPSAEALCALGRIKADAGLSVVAMDYFEKAINLGSSDAANRLGQLLVSEKLPGVDEKAGAKRAVELFALAASKGHVEAQSNLGLMRLKGIGCDQSYEEAKLLFERAEKSNDPQATFYLGYLAYREATSSKDDNLFFKANSLFRKSLASQPLDAETNYYLGHMLEMGWGGSKDLVLAAKHYEIACQSDPNNNKAKFKLGRLYLEGRGVSHTDREKAIGMIISSADQGNSDAAVYLGDLYLSSPLVQASPATAMIYYQKAARMGNSKAQHQIADLLRAFPDQFRGSFDPLFFDDRARISGFLPANRA